MILDLEELATCVGLRKKIRDKDGLTDSIFQNKRPSFVFLINGMIICKVKIKREERKKK